MTSDQSAIDILGEYHKSKPFRRYMETDGVREYLYFAGVRHHQPSIADAAMALHESRGGDWCASRGIEITGGHVMANGKDIGVSILAQGKATKGIAIDMWLEEVGTTGFVTSDIRDEVDATLGSGWFDDNVGGLITSKLVRENNNRVIQLEISQEQKIHRNTLTEKWIRVIIETPNRWKVKFHYWWQGVKRRNHQ